MLKLYHLSAITLLFLLTFSHGSGLKVNAQSGDGFILLNELNPWASDDAVHVELINPTDSAVTLDGWSVSFLSGFSYTFPQDAGEIPGGGIHVLNITGPNPLTSDGDGCTLSDATEPVDAVAWGLEIPGVTAPLRFYPPLWPEYEVYSEEIMFQPDDVIIRKPGSWPPNVINHVGRGNWAYRNRDHESIGFPNPNPGPVLFMPMDGSINVSRFPLQVYGFDTDAVLFQVATDENFENIVMEEISQTHQLSTSDLPSGTYYWRVKDANRLSDPWSIFVEVSYLGDDYLNMVAWFDSQLEKDSDSEHILLANSKRGEVDTLPPEPESDDITVISVHVVGGMHYLQNKDTDMVCLDGDQRDGDYNWEDPHPEEIPLNEQHNGNNCSRASLAMIAASSGCELSQDRISYYIFEEMGDTSRSARDTGHIGSPAVPDPYMDLGHGRGVWTSDALKVIDWLYGASTGTTWEHQGTRALFNDGDASDIDTIKEYLDAGILIYRSIPGHAQVVDGYTEFTDSGSSTVRVFLRIREPGALSTDPLCVGWTESWISDDIHYMFPPSTGSPIRCDEPGISMDSDGDGLYDFDEEQRFLTDPNNTDSDDDGVMDMDDMLGYMFNIDGDYEPRDRDIDGDGMAKELDPDNDRENDDGLNDGCEDFDANGFFDDNGRESDCFNFEDDFTVLNPACFTGYIHLEADVRMSQPGMSAYTTVWEDLYLESGSDFSIESFAHEHHWELTGQASVDVGIPGFPVSTAISAGGGQGLASIEIEIDDDGNYVITTDTDPRSGTYTITASGRMTTYPLYFGFANHHYEYVSPEAPPFAWDMLRDMGKPNIFEGTIETRDDGYVVLQGDETWDMPDMGNLTGSLTRQWEIIVSGDESP